MTRAVTLAEIADTNTFIVDGTNNRVGIASTIPTATLDVNGVVKATSFTGNATGLTGTPDIAVRNITGVAATFTGVLTYEDVTNIDSIGIITARSDVSIADKIIHTGDTNTAIRFPAADTFTVETGGSERLRADSSGRLLVGGGSTTTTCTALFQGRSDGATNSANLRLSKGSYTPGTTDSLGIISFGDKGIQPAAQIQVSRDSGTWSTNSRTPGAMLFMTAPDSASAATERLRITSAGLVRVPDNGKFTAGAGDDLQIYVDGTDSFIDNDEGDLLIRNTGDDIIIRAADDVLIQTQGSEGAIIARGDGTVELYHDNSKKLETSSAGVTVTGTLNATTDVTINGKGAATTGKAIAMAMVFG